MDEKKLLYLALGVSALIRSVIFFLIYPDTSIITALDQRGYLDLADYLAQHRDFGIGFGAERMPLYPLFIALCQLFSKNLFFLLIIQNLIGIFSVYLLYKVGLLISRRLAIITAFLAALNLNFAVQSNTILTESIFYPVFTIFLLNLFQYSRTKDKFKIASAGFILGVSTLIRSVTMYLPPVIILYLIFQTRLQFTHKLRHIVYFLAVFAIVITPWMARNYTIYGYPGLTSQGSGHIIGWIVADVRQNEEKIDLSLAMQRSSQLWEEKKKTFPERVRNNPFRLDKEAKKYGLEYLLSASPLSVAKAWFFGAMKNIFVPVTVELAYIFKMDWTHFYESPGTSAPEQAFNFIFRNKNKVYSTMLITSLLTMLLFRIVQVYGGWKFFNQDREIFWISCLIIAYFLIISGPVGYAKYRLPFEPILIMLTALPFERKSRSLEVN